MSRRFLHNFKGPSWKRPRKGDVSFTSNTCEEFKVKYPNSRGQPCELFGDSDRRGVFVARVGPGDSP